MMTLRWMGGPSFALDIGALRVVGDPVSRDAFDLAAGGETVAVRRLAPAPPPDGAPADVVCVTSYRADHWDGPAATAAANGPVLGPAGAGETAGPAVSPLAWGETFAVERDGERLEITAVPARCSSPADAGNGYFLRHRAGDRETTVYWTGDALWSDAIRAVQREYGYANLLLVHIGAEPDGAGGRRTPSAKDAMQIVYRMQPNAIIPLHHATFSHYTETVEPFAALIARTIYEHRLHVLSVAESWSK